MNPDDVRCKPRPRPTNDRSQGFELCVRRIVLVEVALAQRKEMPGRVVVGTGVPNCIEWSSFEDIPIAIDHQVIGDVRPTETQMMILMLPEPGGSEPIVQESDGRVVVGDPFDRV